MPRWLSQMLLYALRLLVARCFRPSALRLNIVGCSCQAVCSSSAASGYRCVPTFLYSCKVYTLNSMLHTATSISSNSRIISSNRRVISSGTPSVSSTPSPAFVRATGGCTAVSDYHVNAHSLGHHCGIVCQRTVKRAA